MMNSDKIYNAFDAVHAEDSLKRSTKAFIYERIRPKQRSSHFKHFAIAFACFAVVMLGFGSWNFYMTPVSAISVDVNPSVELGVNRFDRVVSVKSYNDEGAAIIAAADLKNLKYVDALENLFGSEAIAPYINDDSLVSVTIIGGTAKKGEEMHSRISACRHFGLQNVECCFGNREEMDAAHEAGLSFGKYHAFLELHALDPDITADDIRNWTMRQIRNRIDELSNGSYEPQNKSGGKGPGYDGNRKNSDGNAEEYQKNNNKSNPTGIGKESGNADNEHSTCGRLDEHQQYDDKNKFPIAN
ncbi:MAG: anti-sigma-I factor RsgI family protein [Lachnospiraceae bacterium]|jgi:hypothetical protein